MSDMGFIEIEICGGPADGRRRRVAFDCDHITVSHDVELESGDEGVLIDTYESKCESIPGEDGQPVFLFRHTKREFRKVIDILME